MTHKNIYSENLKLFNSINYNYLKNYSCVLNCPTLASSKFPLPFYKYIIDISNKVFLLFSIQNNHDKWKCKHDTQKLHKLLVVV